MLQSNFHSVKSVLRAATYSYLRSTRQKETILTQTMIRTVEDGVYRIGTSPNIYCGLYFTLLYFAHAW